MLASLQSESLQTSLIHFVHEDDLELLASPGGAWFRILYYFPWKEYRVYGAHYYDALYDFNRKEAEKRKERTLVVQEDIGNESKEEAQQRLLFDRVTMQKMQGGGSPILYQRKEAERKAPTVDPESISPGTVPVRLGGKKPKCFFAMFKSFLGATLMGFPAEPETVYSLLTSNPSFVRVCGFAPKKETNEYCYQHVPSLRKIEQFDQIMKESGLWHKIKLDEVRNNLQSGVIQKEDELVGDTTHYYCYSGFETVKYVDENGKEKRKSQSKVTKNCRCKDRETCPHPWELADDGAGTIVKSNKKMHWGHKASILGYPRQGIPLDATAVSDAATFDGETLYPHLQQFFQDFPEMEDSIQRVLYDSACDNQSLKKSIKDDFGIDLKASFNPRRKKEITENLPQGIEKITPYGIPICNAGYEMDYKGMRYENEKFIYQAPTDSDNTPVCSTCFQKKDCCPNAGTGRIINIAFDRLPHIDAKDPPMAKRFKAILSRRPAVERMIKRLKCDLSDDRLTKRGNGSFQAYLDKTMIAFHLLLRP